MKYEDLIRRGILSHIILDEADMLLTGNYVEQSWKILDLALRPYSNAVMQCLPSEVCTWICRKPLCIKLQLDTNFEREEYEIIIPFLSFLE